VVLLTDDVAERVNDEREREIGPPSLSGSVQARQATVEPDSGVSRAISTSSRRDRLWQVLAVSVKFNPHTACQPKVIQDLSEIVLQVLDRGTIYFHSKIDSDF
jgi:hypothetical protein